MVNSENDDEDELEYEIYFLAVILGDFERMMEDHLQSPSSLPQFWVFRSLISLQNSCPIVIKAGRLELGS